MAGFAIVVVRNQSTNVMALSGDVDIEHADDLASVGLLTLNSLNGHGEGLIIDMHEVTFMDSTGLGALVTIRNAAKAEGREVTLRGMRPRVAKVMAITGLSDWFDVTPADAEQAAEA
jgi:anti-sigma B factor antagonist